MIGYITVFADASFDNATKSAGIAYWCRDDDNVLQNAQRIQWEIDSSGEAELIALCTAIAFAVDHIHSKPGYILVAQSDCQQALEMIENGAYITTTQCAFVEMARSVLKSKGVILRVKHVKGHTGANDRRSYVNRWCDTHARKCMRYERSQRNKQKRGEHEAIQS